MTVATAQLCGHRWLGHRRCPYGSRGGGHQCGRWADHRDNPSLTRHRQCVCRCMATTERSTTK